MKYCVSFIRKNGNFLQKVDEIIIKYYSNDIIALKDFLNNHLEQRIIISIEDNFESTIDDDAQSESTSKESFEIPEDTQVAEYFKFPVIEGWIDDNTPVTLLYKRKPSAEGYVICLDRDGNEIEVEAVQFIFGRIVEAK